jgi:outer membrane protein TolC
MLVELFFALAIAQDTARPPRLLLGDVYREARQSSPRAQAARSLAVASRAMVASAGLPPDPQLQLGLMNYELPRLAPMDQVGMAQIQLMQMLPVAGKLRLSRRIAASRADAVAERAGDVEWDVRANVAMAFYDLFATDRALDVARQTLFLLQNIRRTAESMYRVGEGRQADILRAQVEVSRMIEDSIRMTAMRTAMAGRLNALLARGDLATLSPALPEFPDSVPPPDSLIAQALRTRPMVKAIEGEVAAAGAETELARREIWPDLVVGAQYGQRSGALGGTERMGSVMLGATIPVFAGKRQLRMRQEAVAMSQMVEADLAAMRADTRAQVIGAHANLIRARRLAALYRTTILPQADATVASALAAYRVGGVDFMTLLDAGMTANRFREQLFALEADEGKAWAELEMLVGRELWNPDTVADRGETFVAKGRSP